MSTDVRWFDAGQNSEASDARLLEIRQNGKGGTYGSLVASTSMTFLLGDPVRYRNVLNAFRMLSLI